MPWRFSGVEWVNCTVVKSNFTSNHPIHKEKQTNKKHSGKKFIVIHWKIKICRLQRKHVNIIIFNPPCRPNKWMWLGETLYFLRSLSVMFKGMNYLQLRNKSHYCYYSESYIACSPTICFPLKGCINTACIFSRQNVVLMSSSDKCGLSSVAVLSFITVKTSC